MIQRKLWTWDELVIAMNLYCKLPFGKLTHTNPVIIDVAKQMGRTPSSLSMKLCNFAALDPLLQARGIKGLQGTSTADRKVWSAFHKDWETMGLESEAKFQELMGQDYLDQLILDILPKPKTHKIRNKPIGPTETQVTRKARIGQDFFRQTILSSYGYRCCISGNPVPELLVASHILPWSEFPEQRLNPQNGLCLSQLHDAAFDKGLICFDKDYKLIISKYLDNYFNFETIKQNFIIYTYKPMILPEKFQPDLEFLKYHRNSIFIRI